MASSSSSSPVEFHVRNASGRETPVRVEHPDVLRCRSLDFRELIDNKAAGKTPKITLNLPDSKYGIDFPAVEYILKNLQCDHINVSGGEPEALARHCAALYHYKCIPDIFKEIWDHTQPQSSQSSILSDDQQSTASPRESLRSWPGNRSITTCHHLITIAFVLGIQDVLEEELRFAVWGSRTRVESSLIPVDIEGELCQYDFPVKQELMSVALRQKELRELFNELHKKLDSHENGNRKLVERKRKELKAKKLGDLSRSSEFPQNVEVLRKLTPYEFFWHIENVLMGRREAQTTSPTATTINSQVTDRTIPTVSADDVASRFKRDDIKGKESTNETIREIVDSLDKFITARQTEIAKELTADRNKTIDEWREAKTLNSETEI
jgi:hypothetical protein